MDIRHAQLIAAMTEYDCGDPARTQHFIKVHDLSAVIGAAEGLDERTLFILETAAIVHDIGIHESERRYGSSAGRYQEELGPDIARGLLTRLGGYESDVIDRVCYLVGHHHTYRGIDGMDYQILVEADFLVNLYEDGEPQTAAMRVRDSIFRTPTGIRLLNAMFLTPRQ